MSSRRSTAGQAGRNSAPRGGRYSAHYDEDEENYPRSYRGEGLARRGMVREEDNETYYPSNSPVRGGRQSHESRHNIRGLGTQRQPFFPAREKKQYGASDGGSMIVRLMKGAEKELTGWLRSEGKVASMVSRLIKAMESLEEKLRSESYTGYLGGVWDADDPVSGAVNEKSQNLLSRLKKLRELLSKPSDEVEADVAESFYLLFSAMHIFLTHPDLPSSCVGQIGHVMVAATAIAMRLGDPHVLLSCTTDHLRDSENEVVLLEFQHVLYQIIDSDVRGEKLYGTAHRILDAQMDILESRNDEESAISAINIIGVISLRHPQAFKTRFWDLTDLLIGWYVGATPSDRVFDACLVAFGLFREKFKQEIDFALKMIREFTQEMEAAVKAYLKPDRKASDLEQRATFLSFFQLYALILHSVSERIVNASRMGPETAARQTVRTTMTAILKMFNQILQSSDPEFIRFSTRVNSTLVVVINAISVDCVPVSSQLYLHMRMQQTSAQRIPNLMLLYPEFGKTFFSLMSAVVRATKEFFPLETAKDLLGPDSLLFSLASSYKFLTELQNTLEAVTSSSQPAVREVVFKSFRSDYRKQIKILANIAADPSLSDIAAHLMARHTVGLENKRRPVARRMAVFDLPQGNEAVVAKDFGAKLESLYAENQLFLVPDGMEDHVVGDNVSGVLNFEAVGEHSRRIILVYLHFVEVCLKSTSSADAVILEQEFTEGFYRTLTTEMAANWIEKFPDLTMVHILLARILWQRKCTNLAVKEVMSSSRSVAGINAVDQKLMRTTLSFLDGALSGRVTTAVQAMALEWSGHALKTLIALTASLADLGIETEYLKLLGDLYYFSFCGSETLRNLAVSILIDLYRSHWMKLRTTLTTETLELVMNLLCSSVDSQVALADLLVSKALLPNILMCRYHVENDNTALLQMEQVAPPVLHVTASVQDFPAPFLGHREVCLPFLRNIRLWKRFLNRGRRPGSGDALFADTLISGLLRVKQPRVCEDIKQVLESHYGFTEWNSAVATSTATAFSFLVSDIAVSICHQKLHGLFSNIDSTISFIEALFQSYAPVSVDHMSFVHKTLLDLYVQMKDASMDLTEDWEDIRRLAEEVGEQEVVTTSSARKVAEKRRIYTRTGGITAEDVAGLPVLSWLDLRLSQKNVFVFAEAVERNLNLMIYGSALHMLVLSNEDWANHSKVISASYRTVEQVKIAESTIRSLKVQMLRMAIVLEDDFSVVRLGYPVLLDILREGKAMRVNIEQLSASLLMALGRLRSPHLITYLQEAQMVSEIESGISDTAFRSSQEMANQRYGSAVRILLENSSEEPADLENQLMVDCATKLGDWRGLEKVLSADNKCDEIQAHLLLTRYSDSQILPSDEPSLAWIRRCLDGKIESRKDGAEICALMSLQDSQHGLLKDAIQSLRAVQKLGLLGDIPKFDQRSAVLLYVLERLAGTDGQANEINGHGFPTSLDQSLDMKLMDLDLLNTLLRLNLGGDRESSKYLQSIIKFHRRTGNRSIIPSILTGYFPKRIPDFERQSADTDPGDFLRSALLLGSSAAVHVDDIRLIRQGVSYLAELGHVEGALTVGKQVCFDAFRLIQEIPDESGACLVEVSKSIGRISRLEGTLNSEEYAVLVRDAITDIRFPLDSLFEQSGFALEMFVENHRAVHLTNDKDEACGVLAEMAYMTHCMEGGYSKPALNFGNWCYDQGYRMLAALSRIGFDDLISYLNREFPDQDHSSLTPNVATRVIQLFMDILPIRAGRNEVKAVLEVMRNGLPDLSTIYQNEFVIQQAIPTTILNAILVFCQAQYNEILQFFVRASHMYFIYLRTPAREDLATTAMLRLLELLTALPDVMGEIWMDELTKHDVVVWKGCLTLLLARLYHPQEMAVRSIIDLVVRLARRVDGVLYPVVAGQMVASGMNIGGGACCPNLSKSQRAQLSWNYDRLIDRLIEVFGSLLAHAAHFTTEIQRLSLLWEERWLQFLVSHQALIKRELRGAIRDAMESTSCLARGESVESLEDSTAEDLASYSVEINLSARSRSDGDNLEQVGVEDIDIEGLRRQNSDLVVRSRDATPEVPEMVKEDSLETDGQRKDGKRHVRFPLYESLPWKTRLNSTIYTAAVEPILRKLRSLLEFCSKVPQTPSEIDFGKQYLPILQAAIQKIAEPSLSAEFDEDVLWGPFAQIISDLEERQAMKRKIGLNLGDISRLKQVLKDCGSLPLPMPGWSHPMGRTTIVSIDDQVAVLPTKTKPKKLAFWGTDGYKHSFLCKGLEDLSQDSRIMHFLEMSNKFLTRTFKHDREISRARTYSVLSFGPRAGLIQWVDGSTSMLSLYRCHLERQTVLERQILATKNEDHLDVPPYLPTSKPSRDHEPPSTVTFRVTEDDLQDMYEVMQEEKFADTTVEMSDNSLAEPISEEADPFEKWVNSEDEFSPQEFTDTYYQTLLRKTKKELAQFHNPNQLPMRGHPHIHELYMSFLLQSLRKDKTIDWEKFRLNEKNCVKDVSLEHLKNAFLALVKNTPKELLARDMEYACSSSEEWWMVSRGYVRSLAITSVLGYLLGVGDRHPDNVLIDFHTGEVVHVDYNIAFEKGLRLSIPEIVPYRLTQNLVHALGWDGTDGTFRDVAIQALTELRKNQPTFSHLMTSYLIDPLLDWTTDKSDLVGLNPGNVDTDDILQQKREKAMLFGVKVWHRVRDKLLGIDGPDSKLSTVPDQVDWTVATATDSTNLARMFEGWIAWL